jgi:hypothetical protein
MSGSRPTGGTKSGKAGSARGHSNIRACVKAGHMGADFQADLVAGPPGPATMREDPLRVRPDWEPRSFTRVDERNDGLLIRALALHAAPEDHARMLDQFERGHRRETPSGITSYLSMAREVVLNSADVDLLREACAARSGEIKVSAEGDFQANFTRTASAVHLAQLGYFEALPGEGWRLRPGLRAKVKAALKLEPAQGTVGSDGIA